MSTITLTATTSGLAVPRGLAPYLAELRCEIARTFRNPGIAIPVFALPVGLYLLFATVIIGDGMTKDPALGIFLFTAFSIMGMTMPALFAIGAGLALDREMGLLNLKRAQPAPVGAWLVAKIGAGVLFGVISYLPILTVALLTGKLALETAAVVGMSLVLLASSIPFCAMGLMVGALVKGSAAPGYANVLYLPGCYLSGMFFPLTESLYWQAPIWPQFHVLQLTMHAGAVAKYQFMPVSMSVATLVGYTALFAAVAYWRLARRS